MGRSDGDAPNPFDEDPSTAGASLAVTVISCLAMAALALAGCVFWGWGINAT